MAKSAATSSQEALERAERNFKKKEMQAREASKAMAEYEARARAEREKTARLKLLREAKEAADAAETAKLAPKRAPAPVKERPKKRVGAVK